jgi:hypothetical protein
MPNSLDKLHPREVTLELSLDAVVIAVQASRPVTHVRLPRAALLQTQHGLPRTALLQTPDEVPMLLLHQHTLPGGLLEAQDQTFERGMRRIIRAQTELTVGYAEQLYTFGDANRQAAQSALVLSPLRAVSSCYLALVRDNQALKNSQWQPIYHCLPWEDWRSQTMSADLLASVQKWAAPDPDLAERVAIAFGLEGCQLDSERVLERYELLWQAGLLVESKLSAPSALNIDTGQALPGDARRMLACALGRLRGKLKYRPVIFELLANEFTMLKLQRTTEALIGHQLHKQNFRRLVEHEGLLEATGQFVQEERGRPAELFRFRRAVFRERPAPGVRV